MNWLTERQKVLAQNIANANTPGYAPKDLKKISLKAALDQNTTTGGLRMQTADSRHMPGGAAMSGDYDIEVTDAEFAIGSPDGNAVSLEDELIKMSETQMEYATAVNLYRKRVSMIKTALGKK